MNVESLFKVCTLFNKFLLFNCYYHKKICKSFHLPTTTSQQIRFHHTLVTLVSDEQFSFKL